MVPTQLEDGWRRRLRDARLHLDLARSCLDEVARDLESGTVPPLHVTPALEHAVRAEAVACEHYKSVLAVFTGLVRDGKIPSTKQTAA